MNKELLSRTESAALRGIAILGIILHNYCHFMRGMVRENEYLFRDDRPQQLWDCLQNIDGNILFHLLSFFGHYGVPVFLFVSGFGLVMKYERQPVSSTPSVLPANDRRMRRVGGFLGYHYLKLLRLMVIGYVAFILVYCCRHSNGAEVFSFDRILAHLTMTVNFLYEEPDHIILPGPYWFFGLMLQLYALYALLLHRYRKGWVLLLAVGICWLMQASCDPTGATLNHLRYNFIGGVLPFCMGVAYARYGKTISVMGRVAIVLISALAVFVGGFWFQSWLWVPLFVVTGAVATIQLLPARILSPMVWGGGLSAALFVVHPIVREVVIPHYQRVDIPFGVFLYLLAAIALAQLLQYVIKLIPKPTSKAL